jgi:hypothetical protein
MPQYYHHLRGSAAWSVCELIVRRNTSTTSSASAQATCGRKRQKVYWSQNVYILLIILVLKSHVVKDIVCWRRSLRWSLFALRIFISLKDFTRRFAECVITSLSVPFFSSVVISKYTPQFHLPPGSGFGYKDIAASFWILHIDVYEKNSVWHRGSKFFSRVAFYVDCRLF